MDSDPQAALKSKQDYLRQVQDEIAKDTRQVTVLNADIQSLQMKITEISQAVAGYNADQLLKQLNDAKQSVLQKTVIAEATLKDDKADIDTKIGDFYDNLKSQRDKVDEAAQAVKDATNAARDADAMAKAQQDKYDGLKQKPRELDTSINELRSMLEKAAQAESKQDFVGLYFFAEEANRIASSLNIPSTLDFQAQLKNSAMNAEKARQEAVVKKAEATAALSNYQNSQKLYDAAWASRRTDLMKALEPFRK